MMTVQPAHTTLKEPWLNVARLAWLVLAIALLAGFFLTQNFRIAEVSDLPEEEVRVLAQYGLTPEDHARYYLILEHILEIVFVGIAFGLVWRKSDDWLVMAVSLYLLSYISGGATSSQPFVHILVQLFTLISLLGQNLPFVFPDGRFVPGWTRYAALLWSGWAVLRVIFPSFDPYQWPAPGIGQGGAGLLAILAELPFLALLIYAQIYRYRFISTPIQRQQTKWVLYGIILVIIGELSFLPESLFPVLGEPGLPHMIYRAIRMIVLVITRMAIPITLAISILRYRLWGIDVIINRSLVYAALTVSVIGLYVLIVGSLGRILQTSIVNPVIPFAATGVVAIIFQPMREWFQRGVNRLMYGERDEPYRVLTRLGQQLESAIEPAAALPLTVETVARALKLPYVAVALKTNSKSLNGHAKSDNGNIEADSSEFEVVASYGASKNTPFTFPLIYAGETIGELIAASRAPNEPLSDADRRLLNDLATQISVAAHANLLSADLERARLRIVSAREEARRRLGSDLHDGVGHQLAGLARKTENVANLLERDPSAARELLAEVSGQLNNAITQVRGLAHQLHPPELELLGLAGALRERAQMQNGFMIHIDAPDFLTALPTAIETAAYYIALETLTNIEKHANARTAHIRLAFVDGDSSMLEMEISDDGRGLSSQLTHGLGLLSMQARAAEVGGVCRIESNHPKGTRMRVSLPVLKE